MADLQKVIKVTQAQYDVLASGGSVGGYTGLDDNYIYLVEDEGGAEGAPIINITNGLTADIRTQVQANPGTLLYKDPFIYVPNYLNAGDDIPNFYSCLEADEGAAHYLQINWSNLTISDDGNIWLGNGSLSIQGNGETATSFSANQNSNVTLNIKGQGATTVAKSATNEITISSSDHNQTVTVGNTTFNSDAAINFVGNGGTTITAGTNSVVVTSPTVNNGTLTIQKNGSNVATFSANQSGNATANITVPTKVADLSDASSYINTGSTSQAKSGGLTIFGNFYVGDAVTAQRTLDAEPYWTKFFNMGDRDGVLRHIYAFSGIGDWLYCADKQSQFTIRSTFRGSGLDSDTYNADYYICNSHSTALPNLFNWNYSNGWRVLPSKVTASTPAIIEIKSSTMMTYTDVLKLVLTGHNGFDGSNNWSGILNNYTLEVCTNYTDDTWVTVVNRSGVSDKIGSCPQYALQTSNYTACYGLRLTIKGCSVTGSGYEFINITSMQLRDHRPDFTVPESIGAISAGGGKAYGDIIFAGQSNQTFRPTVTKTGYLGNSSYQFKAAYAETLYENGTALSDKYLGKTSKAADADKLDGHDSSYFATASSIPTVNNATLTIQKNGTTVNTFTANASTNVTANITVPTKTSDLTNDSLLERYVYEVDAVTRPTSSSNYVVYHITAPNITSLTANLNLRIHKSLASDWPNDSTGALKLLQINDLTPIAIFWRYDSFAAWTNFNNVYMTLTYAPTARASSGDFYGYTRQDGFILDFNYDSGNDCYTLYDYSGFVVDSTAIPQYSFVGVNAAGKKVPLTKADGTFTDLDFMFGRGIEWYDGGQRTASTTYSPWNGQFYRVRVGISLPAACVTAWGLKTVTPATTLYAKCSKDGATMKVKGMTTALPSSYDGYYYILLAHCYTSYTNTTGAESWMLFVDHPIYYFEGGALRMLGDNTYATNANMLDGYDSSHFAAASAIPTKASASSSTTTVNTSAHTHTLTVNVSTANVSASGHTHAITVTPTTSTNAVSAAGHTHTITVTPTTSTNSVSAAGHTHAVTVTPTTSTNSVSAAGHTHTINISNTMAFSGSSSNTGAPNATTNVNTTAHTHAINCATASVSVVTGSFVAATGILTLTTTTITYVTSATSSASSATTSVASAAHTHSVTAAGSLTGSVSATSSASSSYATVVTGIKSATTSASNSYATVVTGITSATSSASSSYATVVTGISSATSTASSSTTTVATGISSATSSASSATTTVASSSHTHSLS